MLNSKEHHELIAQFEQEFKGYGRFEKEEKKLWAKGYVYQDGHLNNIFKAYRCGYAYGKCYARMDA